MRPKRSLHFAAPSSAECVTTMTGGSPCPPLDRYEVAARDQLGFARLLVLAFEVAARHDGVDLLLQIVIADGEAVEPRSGCHRGNRFLRPSHDGLDVAQGRGDRDAQVLQDVLALVVPAPKPVLPEPRRPDADKLVEHVGDSVLVSVDRERRNERAPVPSHNVVRQVAAPGIGLRHSTTAFLPGLRFVVKACQCASAHDSMSVESAPSASSKPTPSFPMRLFAHLVAESVSSG